MSSYYYHVCRSCMGRPVAIRTRDGRIYEGIVQHVTPHHVHLHPLGRRIAEGTPGPQASRALMIYDRETDKDRIEDKAEGTEIQFFFPIIPLAAIAGITFIGLASFWWW